MAVPANVCVAWPSTVASIPAGWTRETALDARYILGAAAGADTDLTTDRGSATHSHTSPSHTPIQNAHTHEITSTGSTGSILAGPPPNGGTAQADGHQHASFTSNAATGTNNGIVITVDPAANELAYTEVIWIKSNGVPLTLPSGCYAFFESDTLPAGWSRVKGDRYLKGAAAASNPAADGGSNTHTHTSPAHTHTQNTHSHTATTSGSGDFALADGAGAQTHAGNAHTHAVSLSAAVPTNQSVTTSIDSGDSEPPFKKLNIVSASAADLPTNIITLWLSTNASIPSGWSRYTAMDSKWAKGANANGESGIATGGSSQHLHLASDCQPTQNSHSHSGTATSGASTTGAGTGLNVMAGTAHTHVWTGGATTATNNAVAVTIDLCTVDDALPKHRTVIYIQFTGTPTPPGPPITGVTTYDLDDMNRENVFTGWTPEVSQKIWRGDRRYYEGGPE